jgi:hypothetical protein
MNANDIQTLTNEMCLFYGVPSGKGKLYYLKTSEGGFNIPLSSSPTHRKGTEFTYRNGDLWVTTLYETRMEQVKYPKKILSGNCPEFICCDVRKNQRANRSSRHNLLLILMDKRSGKQHFHLHNMNIDGVPHGPLTNSLDFVPTWNKGNETTAFLPRVNLESACRTWAISGELGEELIQNATGEGTRHAPYTTVLHGRASNIGVTYYDSNGGDFVETKALAQRYGDKYIGRTNSWTETSKTESIVLPGWLFSRVRGIGPYRSDRNYRMEIHFPRNFVAQADTEHNIFGNGIRNRIGGVTCIAKSGLLYRILIDAPFKLGHPLNENLSKTRFRESYTPDQLSTDYWTWVAEIIQEGDELNKEEKDMVGKWFTGYITNMIRKGREPSDEEIEFAKKLGIYKGE